MTVKGYFIGGPMDMQVMGVLDDQYVVSFASTSFLPLPTYKDKDWRQPMEVTQIHYHMVYRSRDGKFAVYIAEDAMR